LRWFTIQVVQAFAILDKVLRAALNWLAQCKLVRVAALFMVLERQRAALKTGCVGRLMARR
jgi:hypothetical protein